MALDRSESVLHLRQFFRGHEFAEQHLARGRLAKADPEFRVAEIGPGPRLQLWSYASIGASLLTPAEAPRLEFVLALPEQNPRGTELITMIAWYHFSHGLGVGHTLPVGEPWLPGATCDHLLISVPYPYGPELELYERNDEHLHVFWALPITKAERDFKVDRGLDALEERFDKEQIEFWARDRRSVIRPGVLDKLRKRLSIGAQ